MGSGANCIHDVPLTETDAQITHKRRVTENPVELMPSGLPIKNARVTVMASLTQRAIVLFESDRASSDGAVIEWDLSESNRLLPTRSRSSG
jgi:hypothetical protein